MWMIVIMIGVGYLIYKYVEEELHFGKRGGAVSVCALIAILVLIAFLEDQGSGISSIHISGFLENVLITPIPIALVCSVGMFIWVVKDIHSDFPNNKDANPFDYAIKTFVLAYGVLAALCAICWGIFTLFL